MPARMTLGAPWESRPFGGCRRRWASCVQGTAFRCPTQRPSHHPLRPSGLGLPQQQPNHPAVAVAEQQKVHDRRPQLVDGSPLASTRVGGAHVEEAHVPPVNQREHRSIDLAATVVAGPVDQRAHAVPVDQHAPTSRVAVKLRAARTRGKALGEVRHQIGGRVPGSVTLGLQAGHAAELLVKVCDRWRSVREGCVSRKIFDISPGPMVSPTCTGTVVRRPSA